MPDGSVRQCPLMVYHITARIEAYHGDVLVFERDYEDQIERDFG